jgi:predicted CXXCH cytochrome family protein
VKRIFLAGVLVTVLAGVALAQVPTGDVLGVHDLGSGTSPIRGSGSNACLYCHAPHSGQSQGPLWAQKFSTQAYTFYTSDTAQNRGTQPPLGSASTLCLSCHDGTVAVGQTVPYGKLQMSGPSTIPNSFGGKLENSHPFSLVTPLQDAANLVSTLASTGATADTTNSVKLVNGNVECTSCHNAHIQKIDTLSPNFLVRDNRKGGLCLSCHSTDPRIIKGLANPLAQWNAGVHSTSVAAVSPAAGLGGYSTVADTACLSCHRPHNAGGPKSLLRGAPAPAPTVDATSQSCMSCHAGGDKLVVPILNVFSEFLSADKKGHPFANADNQHSANEAVVLDQNRHATCADCHDAHASKQTTDFNSVLPPSLRPSQNGVSGVAADGTKLTGTALNQYENCLRCHGSSSGKQALQTTYGYLPARALFGGDALNLILQFGTTAASSHPVMRDATKQSQPSLLGSMWDILGRTPMRPIGSRIYCTDCHNNDNAREFGGTGPNGPHGSKNSHILERPYIASQVNVGTWPVGGPGTPITNLNYPVPPLDPGSGGAYALCAKCHDLNNVMADVSFPKHSLHIGKGFSCSVCHTAHGVPAGSPAGSSGRRLINFDVNVVGPNAGTIAYTTSNTCVLTCHMTKHNADGSVVELTASSPAPF